MLRGGKGRIYFFDDIDHQTSPEIDFLGCPEYRYDGGNFELLQTIVTDELFSKPQTPQFVQTIEADSFLRDAVDSVEGSILYSNGSKYVGEIGIQERCGKGTIIFRNGERYTGNWLGGLKHGEGVYNWPNGDFYQGSWVMNRMENRGVMYLASGECYSGIWRAGNLLEGYYEQLS